MTSKLCRLVGWVVICLTFASGHLQQSASALDTPNTLLGIDAMVLNHAGLFRNATPNDGFNTFQFGTFAINNPVTTGYGRYTAFRFQKSATGDCCISHNARLHSDTPESWDGAGAYPIWEGVDINSSYYPAIDRVTGGQIFDPAEYQIEVKFKPLLTQATANSLGVNPFPSNPTYPNIPANLENTAPLIGVGLDVLGGYVFDAETGIYKRAGDGLTYNIGNTAGDFNNNGFVDAADYVVWKENDTANVALPNDGGQATQQGRYDLWKANYGRMSINNLYVNSPRDAEGYATVKIPVTQPSFMQRTFYYNFAQGQTRPDWVVTNGGRVFNANTQTWQDVTVGFGANYQQFGGGPEDPSRPGSKLNLPNGVPLISFGAPTAETGASIEFKSIALTKINPGPIVARLDANSGITFRFGSALSRAPNLPPVDPAIPVDNGAYSLNPVATDQISRFNQNGMTNLFINARTPDAGDTGFMGYQYRMILRGAASPTTFNGTTATVNIRARLTEPLTNANIAQNMTIIAKDLDGNDTAPMTGADEYTFNVALSQFNTSSFTTVSIPLSSFTLSPFVPTVGTTAGSGPFGFANAGDGSITNFNLYEFGIGVLPGGGLLRMELEYLEIRLPSASGTDLAAVPEPATWLLVGSAAIVMGLKRRRMNPAYRSN